MKIKLISDQDRDNRSDIFDDVFNLVKGEYDAPDHLKKSNKMCPPCFIITDEDEVIGVSFFKEITEHLVRTRTTVIKEGHRGQGLGTFLNEEMEKEFRKQGFKKISCNVYADNLSSVILKLKRGYLVEGTLWNHDFEGKHEYVMAKEL